MKRGPDNPEANTVVVKPAGICTPACAAAPVSRLIPRNRREIGFHSSAPAITSTSNTPSTISQRGLSASYPSSRQHPQIAPGAAIPPPRYPRRHKEA